MKPELSFKTLFRSPVRTILTFILLAAVTFALFSRLAEYAVTTREMEAAARRAKGAAAVEPEAAAYSYPSDPVYIHADPRLEGSYPLGDAAPYIRRYAPVSRAQIDAVARLPYISSVSERYMTAGVSDTYFRLDDGNRNVNVYYYDYLQRFVFEATLRDVRYEIPGETAVSGPGALNRLIVEDIEYLTDNHPYAGQTQIMSVYLDNVVRYRIFGDYRTNPMLVSPGTALYGFPGAEGEYSDYIFNADFLESLEPGRRYVFVAVAGGPFLGDFFTDCWCLPVRPADGAFTEDLLELMEITNADPHTFDIVYTDDMDAIMRFAEGSSAIFKGRALTPEDSLPPETNDRDPRPCVISQTLAGAFGLDVGDTLTLMLGTELFEQYKGLGAAAVTRERYKAADIPATLEVVGIYTNTDSERDQQEQPHWSYSVNTIFVPKSMLPADESSLSGHEFSPSEVSFIIDNAWNFEPFLDETAPVIEAMGLTLKFSDGGWLDIAGEFREAEKLTKINIFVFSVAVIAATLFIVYMFVGRKKKEFAIMRALGTTRRSSSSALLLPLMAVAAVAVVAGIGSAWVYTKGTVGQNNVLLALGKYPVDDSVPAWVAAVCLTGELAITLLSALALLRRIGAKPPLALLQEASRGAGSPEAGAFNKPDNAAKAGARRAEGSSVIEGQSVMNPDATSQSGLACGFGARDANSAGQPSNVPQTSRNARGARAAPRPATKKRNARRFILRYVLRHAARSAAKSALAAALAALLLCAIGQLALMRQSYADLVANTPVRANFAGGLPLLAMHNINNNSLVSGSYYYSPVQGIGLDLNRANLVATNDIARYTGEAPDIEYAEGYDESCMDSYGEVIIAGRSLMEQLGLSPGDNVAVSSWADVENVRNRYTGALQSELPDGASDEERMEAVDSEILEILRRYSTMYTIAGVFSTPSGDFDSLLITPGARNAPWGLVVAEITLADNDRVDDFRVYGENIARSTARIKYIFDDSRLEGPKKTLRLIEALYPGAVAAALLIGGFICALIIFQASKESAIMRILGTTKKKAGILLALEQAILGFAGLLLGICVLFIYKGRELAAVSGRIGLFAASLFVVITACAAVCSALATRRPALELLQVRE